MTNTVIQARLLALIALFISVTAGAATNHPSCYQQLALNAPEGNTHKALYILIDQTMPLSSAMRANLNSLLSSHPQSGEQVRIARFSPNIKGQYTELVYEGVRDSPPSEAYLYHLRDQDKQDLLACMADQKKNLQQGFKSAFQASLGEINTQLPRTELLHALKRLSETVLINDEIDDKTVLIISDGMENSEVTSFYRRRTIGKINYEREMSKVNRHDLLADWRGAKVYMYGLGNIKDERKHIKPSQLSPLLAFWRGYFNAGGAIIKELGTPAVLSSQL